jgi:hypothetical protein
MYFTFQLPSVNTYARLDCLSILPTSIGTQDAAKLLTLCPSVQKAIKVILDTEYCYLCFLCYSRVKPLLEFSFKIMVFVNWFVCRVQRQLFWQIHV